MNVEIIKYNRVYRYIQRHTVINFFKGARAIQWRKGNLFIKWFWNNWITHILKTNIELRFPQCIKIYLKWLIDLNVKPNSMKHVQNTWEKIFVTLGERKNFLGHKLHNP